MTGWGFIAASGIAIVCGGYIGVAWDRYKRRPPDDRPRRWVESLRMEKLYVIDDELYNSHKDDNES